MNYSYQRVSTVSQDSRRQEIALQGHKIDKAYIDKVSGKNSDREALNRLRLDVREGDNVYIESISRLGRNVDDLRALCSEFKEKGVTINFVKEGLSTSGDTFRFLLTVLGAVAEMERETIAHNIRKGIDKAKKHGTKSGKPSGRPGRTLPKKFKKNYDKWKKNEITGTEFARLLEVGRTTMYRYVKHYEGQK